MANTDGSPLTGWHLDKKVPIALILLILAQTIGFGAWMGRTEERVANLESRQVALEELRDRMIRVEVLLENLVTRIDRREARNGP